jgi:hypothetical protein
MEKPAVRIGNREAETSLSTLGDEVLERWRVAMASADKALVGQLVQTSHAIRDVKRMLAADGSAATTRPETEETS